MAKHQSLSGKVVIQLKPKKIRQGNGAHTKYAATSRNESKKRYKGQGKG